MENLTKYLPHAPFKFTKWFLLVLLLIFIVGEIIRLPFRLKEEQILKNDVAQVAKIHATKLTLDDVMGKNLPPVPGANADKTIAGIDANNNGIRDDVELAIFNAYPNSAKTRAVLLQYALALQMEFTQPIIDKETVTAVAEDEGSAYMCVGEVTPRTDLNKFIEVSDKMSSFVEDIQLNTEARKKAQKDFFNGHLKSYSNSEKKCDLDLSTLPN